MKLPSFHSRQGIRNPVIIFTGLFLFCFHPRSLASINPSNGARLNFTQVMFEYDEVPGSTHYIITISTEDNKKQAPIKIKNTSLACIVSDLEFGNSYKWHYEAFKKNKSIFKSEDYSFSIIAYYLVDTALFRSKIDLSKKGAFHNDIIILDYLGVAINRQGKPIWYYPFHPTEGNSAPNFRNMRMTRGGTITFLDNTDCFETDLSGKILWKAPNDGKISGEAIEFYHHDFRKLDDGSYVTSSYQFVKESNFYNPSVTSRVRYNTLIQYDISGNVLWSWNEKDHIGKDVIFRDYGSEATEVEGTHLNGFDYDAVDDAFAISFRNNSSILKIDKKSGNVIYDLGVYNIQNRKQRSTPWFARQHGPVILPGHQLLIYNNNVTDDSSRGATYPEILIVKEPENGREASKVWEYECRSDRFPHGITGKEGYAVPLPNGNILVCMGGVNYTFEVTPEKEIVWQCSFEKYDDKQKTWTGFNNYRCNFASSLYTKYFTLQYSNERKSKNNSYETARINNEGTDEDNYRVEAVLPDGITKIFSDTITLKGRSSQTVKIPLDNKKMKGGIIVLATSLFNPSGSKFLVFKEADLTKK